MTSSESPISCLGRPRACVLVAVSLAVALFGGCPGCPQEDQAGRIPPSDDGIVLTGATRIVDGEQLSVSEVGPDSIILTVRDASQPVVAGNVLAGLGPDGHAFLRRVMWVETLPDGRTVAHTEQASLAEAIQDGRVTIRVDFADGKATSTAQELIGRVSLAHVFSTVSGDVEARLTDGYAEFQPSLDMSFDFQDGSLSEAQLVATGQLTLALDGVLDIHGSVGGGSKWTSEDELPLKFEHRFLIWASYVPIEGVVVLSYGVGFEAEAAGRVTLSTGFDAVSSVTTGVRFADGDWQFVWEPAGDFTLHDPAWTVEVASGSGRFFVKPKLSVRFYEVAGPFIAVKGYLQGRLDTGPDCPWDVGVGLLGEFGGELKILDKVLLSASLTSAPWEQTLKTGFLCQYTDSDGDGVPDDQDGCPNDPNKTSPGNCGCGQPETPDCGAVQVPQAPGGPAPDHGATGVSVEADLDWAGAARATTYDVYFGTTNPPATRVGSPTSSNWPLARLSYSTTYYWKIVAKSNAGSTAGAVWSFTTQAQPTQPPAAPSAPNPADGATDVSVEGDLDWADAARATSYDVYFGTTNPPTTKVGSPTSSNWPLATLSYSTTYYWKVVGKNSAGDTPGPVWSFTTHAPPTGDLVISGSTIIKILQQPLGTPAISTMTRVQNVGEQPVTACVRDVISIPQPQKSLARSDGGILNGTGEEILPTCWFRPSTETVPSNLDHITTDCYMDGVNDACVTLAPGEEAKLAIVVQRPLQVVSENHPYHVVVCSEPSPDDWVRVVFEYWVTTFEEE